MKLSNFCARHLQFTVGLEIQDCKTKFLINGSVNTVIEDTILS